jgi:hypothetical protein
VENGVAPLRRRSYPERDDPSFEKVYHKQESGRPADDGLHDERHRVSCRRQLLRFVSVARGCNTR